MSDRNETAKYFSKTGTAVPGTGLFSAYPRNRVLGCFSTIWWIVFMML